MIRLTGLNKYKLKTERQKLQVKQGAANYVRAATKAVLKDLVLNTPQWSGETASSWRVDLNYLPASDEPSPLAIENWKDLAGNNPRFLGDKRALTVALAHSNEALKAIRYNTVVRIVNTAPYADTLATASEEELKLRKGNFIPGDVMAVKYVSIKYKLSSNIVGLQLKDVMNYE